MVTLQEMAGGYIQNIQEKIDEHKKQILELQTWVSAAEKHIEECTMELSKPRYELDENQHKMLMKQSEVIENHFNPKTKMENTKEQCQKENCCQEEPTPISLTNNFNGE